MHVFIVVSRNMGHCLQAKSTLHFAADSKLLFVRQVQVNDRHLVFCRRPIEGRLITTQRWTSRPESNGRKRRTRPRPVDFPPTTNSLRHSRDGQLPRQLNKFIGSHIAYRFLWRRPTTEPCIDAPHHSRSELVAWHRPTSNNFVFVIDNIYHRLS